MMAHRIRSFLAEETGTILVFWGISVAVVCGLIALVFDLGQRASEKQELQSFADHVALAAVGELDGKSDAITRATAAANGLIADRQSFGQGSHALSGANDISLTFFTTLPSSDTAAMTTVTTSGAQAAFVRATVAPRTVPWTFGAAFYSLTGRNQASTAVGADAVAGFTEYACDITPLMFCVPNPSFAADANIGKMIRLRSGGQGAAWGPGDFGFLDPNKLAVDQNGPCANLNGVQLDACLIGAIGSVTQCFSQRGVDTEPGQKVGVEDAIFNVRFDIYKSIMNGKSNNPLYAPAPNVIKGIVPKTNGNGNGNGPQCINNNVQASPNSLGIPRDTCFANSSCTRYGDGNWSAGRTAYVQMNYGGTDPFPSAATRFAYYKAEIAAHGGGASSTPILTGRAETGRPMCSPNQSSDPDRRVVIAAGIDCAANPINGRATAVPVKEFVKLFLTEPVGTNVASPPTLDLWVEVVGSAGGNGGAVSEGIVHDVVQLYR